MINTTTLYRPVGLKELILILDAGAKAFPPRLMWQPVFYPVLNQEYAIDIITKWNLEDENSGYSGFVMRFEVHSTFLAQYEVQTVGALIHQELWIPSEDLEEMNQNIQGEISMTKAFYGDKYDGIIPSSKNLNKLKAGQQLLKLMEAQEEGLLEKMVQEEFTVILSNYAFWRKLFLDSSKINFMDDLSELWRNIYPTYKLCF
jgi:hypothetical protein